MKHSNQRKPRMQDKPTAAIKIRGEKPLPVPQVPTDEITFEVQPEVTPRKKKK